MKEFRTGVRTQVLIILSVFLILLNFIMGKIMMEYTQTSLRTQIHSRMLDTAASAASMIRGDDYEKITKNNADSPEYRHVKQVLEIFTVHTTLEYVYGLRRLDDGTFIFTIDPALSNATEFGEVAQPNEAMRKAITGIPAVTQEPYTDSYGKFYTAYCPILNSNNEVVGLVAADCNAEWYDNQMNKIRNSIIASCIVSLLIGAGIVFVFANRLRKKFIALNSEMRELAIDIHSFTKQVIGNNKKDDKEKTDMSIRELEQRSFDEIKELGVQIKNMRIDLQKYIENVYSIAYKDPLTGVKSKQAYAEKEKQVDYLIKNKEMTPFSLVVLDINNLKYTNDTYGHKAGDKLICDGCHIICTVFAHSPVYRIGGDEFVVFLTGQDFEHRMELIEHFNIYMEDKINEDSVTIAAGMVDYRRKSDTCLQDVFVRADKRMYEFKMKLKQQIKDIQESRGAYYYG